MWSQDALTAHLRSIEGAEVTMSFAQIDAVVGELPDAARTHNAYWANSVKSRPHSRAWLDAGFTASPNFNSGTVRFTRGAAPAPREGRSGAEPRRPSGPLRWQEPIVPEPTGEEYTSEIVYAWLAVGEVTLAGGRLVLPALGPVPGIYRFELRGPSGDVEGYYVGESDNLFSRMNGYRNPGPLQSTNERMNARMQTILESGGSVVVSVVLEATCEGTALSLGYKPGRLIVENVELIRLRLSGATIENLGKEP